MLYRAFARAFVGALLTGSLWLALALSFARTAAEPAAPPTYRVATYNVENYHLAPFGNRPAKSAASRARVRDVILSVRPDVLALQEMGETNALFELQAALRAGGLDLPYWEHVRGWDTNIFVAVLSRFPVTRRTPHTNDIFLLDGRRFHTSRGTAELEFSVTPRYRFTLLTTHLKSQRQSAAADEADLREQEALLLRQKIERLLREDPQINLVVAGDFNDSKDSRAVRTVLHGSTRKPGLRLVDSRPTEANGDSLPAEKPNWDPRNVAWTHYYGKEDSYARLDYLLLSPGLAREWEPQKSHIAALPNWGLASDHRLIYCEFHAVDE